MEKKYRNGKYDIRKYLRCGDILNIVFIEEDIKTYVKMSLISPEGKVLWLKQIDTTSYLEEMLKKKNIEESLIRDATEMIYGSVVGVPGSKEGKEIFFSLFT